jgi:hypothetical protein
MPSSCKEPTIYDLLDDPLTQLVMRADRVDPRALRRMLGSVALGLQAAGPDEDQPNWQDFPPAGHPTLGQRLRAQICGAC